MQLQIEDEDFKYSALAIGLQFVNNDSATAAGVHDSLIIGLGNWINGLGKRPVFLRIGYEFDAPDWNFYKEYHFKNAFRRIRDMYDSMQIENIAYVWHSKGWGTSIDELAEWYPGDEYVDWCAYTHFGWGVGGKTMIDFAREHNKPLFIAEATPQIFDGDTTITQDCFLDNPEQAKKAWNEWFIPFFKVIEDNPDVVKAISYINVDWPAQPMWEANPFFMHVDSRLHLDSQIKANWIKKTSKREYLKASPELFDHLWETK
ncbi:Beta-1,3-xylanase XYL4 [subsurface metagenome]